MTIRPAVLDDIPAVLPLVAKICALHEQWDADRFKTVDHPERSYDRWLRERAKDSRSVFLVAEHEGGIVGYIVSTIEQEIPIYATTECGWVHDLWIDEGYRNEGAGRQMTMLTIERFKELGIRQVRLQTASANEIAWQMFASCGFRPATVEMLVTI